MILFQEWPEEDYPSYANGPGYVLSSDIAKFVVSDFEKHKLRVCVCMCVVCAHAHRLLLYYLLDSRRPWM